MQIAKEVASVRELFLVIILQDIVNIISNRRSKFFINGN